MFLRFQFPNVEGLDNRTDLFPSLNAECYRTYKIYRALYVEKLQIIVGKYAKFHLYISLLVGCCCGHITNTFKDLYVEKLSQVSIPSFPRNVTWLVTSLFISFSHTYSNRLTVAQIVLGIAGFNNVFGTQETGLIG